MTLPFLRGLRSRLLSLVAVALLPLAAFSIAGVVSLADAKRQDFEQSMADIVRALSSAVDNELQRSAAVAHALAAAPAVSSGDLRGFYDFARQVLAQQPNWSSVVLSTPDGEYVFNTSRPFGERLPEQVGAPSEVQEASRSRSVIVGDLGVGRVSGEHLLPVRAPVVVDGVTRYVLSVGVKPESLQAVLHRQAIPVEATVAVLDRNRRIVARSRGHQEYLGRPATPSLQSIMAGRLEGFGHPETLDGRKTYAAFSTSSETGWSVVIGLPLEQVGASQRYAYVVLIVGLVLSLALGAAAALWLSRGIVRPVERLRDAARDIERGEEVQASGEGFSELAEVSQTLAAASKSLRESSALRATLLQREQEGRAVAERASREKDEFLAMLSHELRNPLAAMTNAFELLRRLPPESERTPAVRSVIERQLSHMRYLINDLLDVSRAVTGKIVLARRQEDLASCVRDALHELTESGALRGHRVEQDLRPVWASIDVHRMQQVASNLLTNAARYSPPGSAIGVSLRREGAWAVFEVRDEGIGMDDETRTRIFDLFFQGAVTPDRSQGGLGVGLTLTKRLVELHGGTIEAHSSGAGEGSRFIVRIPATEGPGSAAADPPPQDAWADQDGRRVLVVDDNRDHADSLAELLRMNGFTAWVAYDGEDAVRQATLRHPHLVLLDIGLPKQDGYEVCRTLRAAPGGERLKIVALTGWGQESDRQKSRDAGFDSHLTKPVEFQELIAGPLRTAHEA